MKKLKIAQNWKIGQKWKSRTKLNLGQISQISASLTSNWWVEHHENTRLSLVSSALKITKWQKTNCGSHRTFNLLFFILDTLVFGGWFLFKGNSHELLTHRCRSRSTPHSERGRAACVNPLKRKPSRNPRPSHWRSLWVASQWLYLTSEADLKSRRYRQRHCRYRWVCWSSWSIPRYFLGGRKWRPWPRRTDAPIRARGGGDSSPTSAKTAKKL